MKELRVTIPTISPQKPSLFTAIAVMTLTSGIVNIFWSVIAFTHFLGIICAPVTILPAVLGIFEIIYASKLLGVPSQPIQPSQSLAILEIVCFTFGNIFSMVVGILTLVFYNDRAVKNYFAGLSVNPIPVSATNAPIHDSPPILTAPPERKS